MGSMGASTFNIADLFEQAVDAWPERAYVCDERARRTYAEMEARANRLAHHLAAQGVGPGDRVGIYARNRVEWVEALWAVFKLRAVWININYRYVDGELADLFARAGLRALIVEEEFAGRARGVAPQLEQLVIGAEYESALAAQSPERDFGPRRGDDHYILFTGGTTGMPKGVVWRHEDVVMALGGGVDIRTGAVVEHPSAFLAKATDPPMITFPLPPLMHGASQWSVIGQAFVGSASVLRARFDPAEVWRTVAAERCNSIFITGDAMARPLIDEYRRLVAAGEPPDTSSLLLVNSSAVLFSQTARKQLVELLPSVIVTDSVGSSEGGANGWSVVAAGSPVRSGPRVTVTPQSLVVDDDLRPVEPGSGVIGRIARTGNIPIGYLDDPVRTAEVFVTAADGTRYVIPGDHALVEADGTVTLLGRGSVCINTGGEKVFPEEVEGMVKSHPAVYDAVVVGVPDERWGERVAAVVALDEGEQLTLDVLAAHCRAHLAGYKLPRTLVVVDAIERSPAGKPDYPWAKAVATGRARTPERLP